MRHLLPLLLLLAGCATTQSAELLDSPAGHCVQADPAKQCCGPSASPAMAARYGDEACDRWEAPVRSSTHATLVAQPCCQN